MTDPFEDATPAQELRGIRRMAFGRGGVVALALIATSLALTLGFLVKRQCLPGQYKPGYEWTRNCYSDIRALYDRPGAKPEPGKKVPFSHHGVAFRDQNLEYPPLTGLFISSVNAPVRDSDVVGFVRANAFGLSLFGLAAAAALAAVARHPRRLVMFVAAPALISYAFHNWDLIAVGFTAVGLWAFVRDKDSFAGAMLGLGAASKLYPAFLVPVLILARRREGRPSNQLFLNSLLWFAIPSVVVIAYAGLEGWWFPFKFQGERGANFETLWFFIMHHGQRWAPSDFWANGFAKSAQAISILIFLVWSLLLLIFEWRRATFRPVATSFAIVIVALITAKVYSPQYAIWLLPFFVLVRVPWHAYLAFVVGDLLVLAAIWAFFATYPGSQNDWHIIFLEVSVYVRYVLLGYVLWWVRRRGEDLTGEEPAVLPRPSGEEWIETAPAAPPEMPPPALA